MTIVKFCRSQANNVAYNGNYFIIFKYNNEINIFDPKNNTMYNRRNDRNYMYTLLISFNNDYSYDRVLILHSVNYQPQVINNQNIYYTDLNELNNDNVIIN